MCKYHYTYCQQGNNTQKMPQLFVATTMWKWELETFTQPFPLIVSITRLMTKTMEPTYTLTNIEAVFNISNFEIFLNEKISSTLSNDTSTSTFHGATFAHNDWPKPYYSNQA